MFINPFDRDTRRRLNACLKWSPSGHPPSYSPQPTMKVDHPPLFFSPKLSASSFVMPSRPMKRSRSRSGDGQVDRPLVSILAFRSPSKLSSPYFVEASIASPCKHHGCSHTQTILPHPPPSYRFLTAKVDNLLHGWLLYDSVVGTQASE